jgi:hypothetical protein
MTDAPRPASRRLAFKMTNKRQVLTHWHLLGPPLHIKIAGIGFGLQPAAQRMAQ